MKIIVNGKAHDVAAGRLPDLLQELDLPADHVATALNGRFVPKAERAATALTDGDRVEVLSPMQGG